TLLVRLEQADDPPQVRLPHGGIGGPLDRLLRTERQHAVSWHSPKPASSAAAYGAARTSRALDVARAAPEELAARTRHAMRLPRSTATSRRVRPLAPSMTR